jgi:hydroxymethylglutaryl-CoA lyase
MEVRIREVGPRDGFQYVKQFIPTDTKLEIIQSLSDAGISEMETTSFANPSTLPQFKDAEEVMKRVSKKRTIHSAMVFNRRGAESAIVSGTARLVTVISASETHNRKNLGKSIAGSIAAMDEMFFCAKENGIPVDGAIAVSFGCPFEGRVSQEVVMKIADAYVSKGASVIILADTTGLAVPTQVESMVGLFRDRFPDTPLSLHFHNNRGNAMANLLAALLSGVDRFDTALGGIGGCPFVPKAAGNIPTEDAVSMLAEMGIQTGIKVGDLILAARRLEMILGETLPGQVMKDEPCRIKELI